LAGKTVSGVMTHTSLRLNSKPCSQSPQPRC
jgi:hypothetical protein